MTFEHENKYALKGQNAASRVRVAGNISEGSDNLKLVLESYPILKHSFNMRWHGSTQLNSPFFDFPLEKVVDGTRQHLITAHFTEGRH